MGHFLQGRARNAETRWRVYVLLRSSASPPAEEGGLLIEDLRALLDGRDATQIQKDVQEGFKKIGVRW